MRKITIILLSFLLAAPAFADAYRDSLWARGVNAYTEGNYEAALASFSELENRGYASAELFYNIGNCYFKRNGYVGKSILYYERSLKYDPSFEDADNNLKLAQEMTTDRIDVVPEFVLWTWIKRFRDSIDSNSWACISLGCFALLALLLLLFRFSNSLPLRKTAFFVSIFALLFSILSFLFALSLNRKMNSEKEAVVMTPVSSVKSSPSETQASLFIIHEGTKLEVIEELGDWTRIRLTDGRQGWILAREMEII